MEVTEEVLDRFLDGDLSKKDRRQVLAWLETDAAAMERLVGRSELHADLRRSLQRPVDPASGLGLHWAIVYGQ